MKELSAKFAGFGPVEPDEVDEVLKQFNADVDPHDPSRNTVN